MSLQIHPELRRALDLHSRGRPDSDLVFVTSQGRAIVGLAAILRRLWKRCGIEGAHAHRFRDTFAVRLLQHGASLYDVARLLGISTQTADRHYTPYVKELQERGARLVDRLDFVAGGSGVTDLLSKESPQKRPLSPRKTARQAPRKH